MATKAPASKILERRALQIRQHADLPLFMFALTGDELLRIADISKVSRDNEGALIGYQRAAVRRHIDEIAEYLNQAGALFPNAVILALSSRVRFKLSRGPANGDPIAQAGVLEIPLPVEGGPRPAWIVDGQQRAIAISKCNRRDLPIPISAFVADDVGIQRDQFLRINNAKPLPRGLISELLPEVNTVLPANLSARRIPSALCDWLNQSDSSPFRGLIRRASTPQDAHASAVISDNSIIRMIQESLQTSSGCLFPYRDISSGETDADTIMHILSVFWRAVASAFEDAWGKSPDKSRLMHGAGIRAMGRLMDRIVPVINMRRSNAQTLVENELQQVKPVCRWTRGRWEGLDGLRWNEIQNVPRHINLLSNFLIRTYVSQKTGAAS